MGTLAAFSLGAEAKTYAVEDEDGNTKYITVYDGKVETTTEEDKEIKTEVSDLYDWEEGETVDDDIGCLCRERVYLCHRRQRKAPWMKRSFLRRSRSASLNTKNWGSSVNMAFIPGKETMSMSFWMMTVPFPPGAAAAVPKPTAFTPSYRER